MNTDTLKLLNSATSCPNAILILEYLKILIWPVLTLIIVLKFRNEISGLIKRLQKANFPGGISVEAVSEKVNEIRLISREERPLQPVPVGLDKKPPKEAILLTVPHLDHLFELAKDSPSLAASALRVDLELALRDFASKHGFAVGESATLSELLSRVTEKGLITGLQSLLIRRLIAVSNLAIHGMEISDSQVIDLLKAAERLASLGPKG